MTNITKTLAVVATLVVGTAVAGGSALAGSHSPFYPGEFKDPSFAHQAPVGSGIPPHYRLGN